MCVIPLHQPVALARDPLANVSGRCSRIVRGDNCEAFALLRCILMWKPDLLPKWIVMTALALTLVGCSREAALTPTAPLEVVVSQPLPAGAKPEVIADWAVYTGNLEAKDPAEIRSRVG